MVVLVFGSLVTLFLMTGGGLGLVLEELGCVSLCLGTFFVFDTVSFYLSLLSLLLLISLVFVYNELSCRSVFFISVSVVSSILCYSSNHVFFFWWFYEVSILSLLFLLVVESPYSERYIAGWYLAGYVVLTSLPMMLCLMYLSGALGSFFMSEWLFSDILDSIYLKGILILLGVLFVTKIPVFPFHAWLPIVHAEATSIVSVCLSGYVMKLGLLGVCRFCWWFLPSDLFGFSYVAVSFFFSLLFFFAAFRELDGKRWLAFLSLVHIVICVVCFFSGVFDSGLLLFVYSLGHGLSAGLVFILLWWSYNLAGSRNWIILKSIAGGSLFFRILFGVSLCTAASFPPVVQFFVEVVVLLNVGIVSWVVFFVFCLYLFLCSLVPFFLLGTLVTRQFCVEYDGLLVSSSLVICIVFMLLWSFFAFVIV